MEATMTTVQVTEESFGALVKQGIVLLEERDAQRGTNTEGF
jgi:hypothetical protein